jgi:hypothetical protein
VRFAILVDVAYEHPAIYAGMGPLEARVVRLYGVVGILGGWVRVRCARLLHVNTSSVLAAPPGD